MRDAHDCPLCDGLGVIDDPAQGGAIKECPECDTEPPFYLTKTLAEIVGPPEEGEVEHYAALEARRVAERRAEEAEFLRRVEAGAAEYRLTLVRWAGDEAVVRIGDSLTEWRTPAALLWAAGVMRKGDVMTFAGWPSDFRTSDMKEGEQPTTTITIIPTAEEKT